MRNHKWAREFIRKLANWEPLHLTTSDRYHLRNYLFSMELQLKRSDLHRYVVGNDPEPAPEAFIELQSLAWVRKNPKLALSIIDELIQIDEDAQDMIREMRTKRIGELLPLKAK